MSTAYAQSPDITLIADPKVLAVSIQESGQPLADLRHQRLIVIGPSPEIPDNQDYTFVRQSVYDKLLQAQSLLPQGLHFCLYEGYRSLALQKMLFDTQYATNKKRYPHWSETELFKETIKLVSPIINQDGSTNIPPHSTGAAIDVYLLDDKGDPLDMGIHPKDWMKDEGGRLSLTHSADISAEAHKNRLIMNKALESVGFVNYPTEYWHWSYGDRYWAFVKHQPHAIFAGNLDLKRGNNR